MELLTDIYADDNSDFPSVRVCRVCGTDYEQGEPACTCKQRRPERYSISPEDILELIEGEE